MYGFAVGHGDEPKHACTKVENSKSVVTGIMHNLLFPYAYRTLELGYCNPFGPALYGGGPPLPHPFLIGGGGG